MGEHASDDDDPVTPAPVAPKDDNADLPALFWDAMPEGAEEHPDFAAIKALEADTTPEEKAENFKIQGNNKLKMGLRVKNKVLLREAITFYSQGVDVKCADNALNAVLLSNRAHVHSLLGNWRKALQDGVDAKALDPANIKAYFRAARAAQKLGEWEQCVALCAEGQAADPAATEFKDILKEASERQAQVEATERRLRESREAEAAPARALAAAIAKRSLRVTFPQFHLPDGSKPFLDGHGELHWPATLMYPGGGEQDVIQDFCESDTFKAHLDVMFGPDAPPLNWDTRNEYTRDRIELYYLTNGGKPLTPEQLVCAMQGKWPEGFSDHGPKRYGDDASRWRRVDEKLSLLQLMQRPDYVCPGMPVFFVVASGTDYKARFLADNPKG